MIGSATTKAPSKSPVRQTPTMTSTGTQTPMSALLCARRGAGTAASKLPEPSPKSSAAALALSALCFPVAAATAPSAGSIQGGQEQVTNARETTRQVTVSQSQPLSFQWKTTGESVGPVQASTMNPDMSYLYDEVPTVSTITPRMEGAQSAAVAAQSNTATVPHLKPGLQHENASETVFSTTGTQEPQRYPAPTSTAHFAATAGASTTNARVMACQPQPATYPYPQGMHHPANDGGMGRMRMFLDATNHFAAHNPMSPPVALSATSHRGRNKKRGSVASRSNKKARISKATATSSGDCEDGANGARLLVTPTPAKAQQHQPVSTTNYSRKKKSLGLLCKLFMNHYATVGHSAPLAAAGAAGTCHSTSMTTSIEGGRAATTTTASCEDAASTTSVATVPASALAGRPPTKTAATPSTMDDEEAIEDKGLVVVDSAAEALGVERRRIYDIVNILESIDILRKRAKNTYDWIGMDHLEQVFLALQQKRHAEIDGEKKGLGRLSQKFLKLFLHGRTTLGMTEASAELGLTQANDFQANGVGMPGIKTKIRRLYDIANVFVSVGIIEKIETDASRKGTRPTFRWAFDKNPDELQPFHPNTVGLASPPPPKYVLSTIHQNGAAQDFSEEADLPSASLEATPTTHNTRDALSKIHEHGAATSLTVVDVDDFGDGGAATAAFLPTTGTTSDLTVTANTTTGTSAITKTADRPIIAAMHPAMDEIL